MNCGWNLRGIGASFRVPLHKKNLRSSRAVLVFLVHVDYILCNTSQYRGVGGIHRPLALEDEAHKAQEHLVQPIRITKGSKHNWGSQQPI